MCSKWKEFISSYGYGFCNRFRRQLAIFKFFSRKFFSNVSEPTILRSAIWFNFLTLTPTAYADRLRWPLKRLFFLRLRQCLHMRYDWFVKGRFYWCYTSIKWFAQYQIFPGSRTYKKTSRTTRTVSEILPTMHATRSLDSTMNNDSITATIPTEKQTRNPRQSGCQISTNQSLEEKILSW